jgi:hypothetical protein
MVILRELAGAENFSIGSKVMLRGALSALYNNRRQVVKIFVPGPQYIKVLQSALADPFAISRFRSVA